MRWKPKSRKSFLNIIHVDRRMRNLKEYPITRKEVLEYLSELNIESLRERNIGYGDLSPLLLGAALLVVEDTSDEDFNRIVNAVGLNF